MRKLGLSFSFVKLSAGVICKKGYYNGMFMELGVGLNFGLVRFGASPTFFLSAILLPTISV